MLVGRLRTSNRNYNSGADDILIHARIIPPLTLESAPQTLTNWLRRDMRIDYVSAVSFSDLHAPITTFTSTISVMMPVHGSHKPNPSRHAPGAFRHSVARNSVLPKFKRYQRVARDVASLRLARNNTYIYHGLLATADNKLSAARHSVCSDAR